MIPYVRVRRMATFRLAGPIGPFVPIEALIVTAIKATYLKGPATALQGFGLAVVPGPAAKRVIVIIKLTRPTRPSGYERHFSHRRRPLSRRRLSSVFPLKKWHRTYRRDVCNCNFTHRPEDDLFRGTLFNFTRSRNSCAVPQEFTPKYESSENGFSFSRISARSRVINQFGSRPTGMLCPGRVIIELIDFMRCYRRMLWHFGIFGFFVSDLKLISGSLTFESISEAMCYRFYICHIISGCVTFCCVPKEAARFLAWILITSNPFNDTYRAPYLWLYIIFTLLSVYWTMCVGYMCYSNTLL